MRREAAVIGDDRAHQMQHRVERLPRGRRHQYIALLEVEEVVD